MLDLDLHVPHLEALVVPVGVRVLDVVDEVLLYRAWLPILIMMPLQFDMLL